MRRSIFAIVLALSPSMLAAQYHISRRFLVGGVGSWDYVVPDAPNHRLYIGRQDRVMVVDENDGHLIGESGHSRRTRHGGRSEDGSRLRYLR